jgi:hypothetical protein
MLLRNYCLWAVFRWREVKEGMKRGGVEAGDSPASREELLGFARENVREWLFRKAQPVLQRTKRAITLFEIPIGGQLPHEIWGLIPKGLSYPACALLNEGFDLFLDDLGIDRSDFEKRKGEVRAEMRRGAHPRRETGARLIYGTNRPGVKIIYQEAFLRPSNAFPQSTAWLIFNEEMQTLGQRFASFLKRPLGKSRSGA